MVDDWGFAKVGCRVLAPSFDGTRPRGSVDG